MNISRRTAAAATMFAAAAVVAAAAWAQAAWPEEDAAAEKRRYIAAVDAVCHDAERQTDTERFPVDTAQQQVAELARSAIAMKAAIGRIAAIRPPEEDAEQVNARFLEPARLIATDLSGYAEQARTALDRHDLEAVQRIVDQSLQPDPRERAMRAFATTYGFVICAGQEAASQ